MILLALPARAQQTAETDTALQPTAQAPVPLADMLTESESVSASIRDIRTDLTADRSAALIAERLTPLTREIDTRLRETRKILAQHPSVEILGSLDGDGALSGARSAVSIGASVAGSTSSIVKLDKSMTWPKPGSRPSPPRASPVLPLKFSTG
jgi:hypothetical protein